MSLRIHILTHLILCLPILLNLNDIHHFSLDVEPWQPPDSSLLLPALWTTHLTQCSACELACAQSLVFRWCFQKLETAIMIGEVFINRDFNIDSFMCEKCLLYRMIYLFSYLTCFWPLKFLTFSLRIHFSKMIHIKVEFVIAFLICLWNRATVSYTFQFDSLESDQLLLMAENWQIELEKRFPKRDYKTTVINFEAKSVFVMRYIKPLNPPEELIKSAERTSLAVAVCFSISLL